MKRFISTALAVFLLLGLAALAVLARPGGANTAVANDPVAVVQAAESQGQAVAGERSLALPAAATEVYNHISIPLNATQQFTAMGLTFTADGLADFIGGGVLEVLEWNPSAVPPQFKFWLPPYNAGTNFALTVGGSYFVKLDKNAPLILSFVGDVPAKTGETGAVRFTLVGTSPNCTYNSISLPLDRTATNAQQMASEIGANAVDQVLMWDPTATPPQFKFWLPPYNAGENFAVRIGYPYFVCLNSNAPTQWP